MNKNIFLKDLDEQKVIFIIRNPSKQWTIKAVKLLWEANVKFIEITFNSKDAISIIKELSIIKPKNSYLGVGTITNPQQLKCIAKHISFVVTPITSKNLIQSINKYKKVAIIGAYTPTEIYDAWSYGADLIKVFPANTPKYIKTLKGPLNNIPMIAVGGVKISNKDKFIESGCNAVCVGASFFQFKPDGSFNEKTLIQNLSKIL